MNYQSIRRLTAAVFLVLVTTALSARPFDVHDLVSMERLSDLAASPDGSTLAFVVRETDLEANRGRTDVWLLDLGSDGAEPRRLTSDEANDWSPRWSADGETLYFLSTRSGSSQVWRADPSGGAVEAVTDLPLDVGNLVVSPAGRRLAVTLEVFPDCAALSCTVDRLAAEEGSPVTGRLYDSLFVRHWDTWKDGRRSHLFAVDLERPDAEPVDLTGGLDADVPSKPFGGDEEITFTPDGSGIVYTARVAGRQEAWSTDFDLWHVPVDGSADPRCLTERNQAWDTQPVFSPDGSQLAYLAMARPGFESDRLIVMLRPWPEGKARPVAVDWDRSISSLSFSPDGGQLWVTAQDTGNVPLFAIDLATEEVRRVVESGHVRSPQVVGDRVVFGRDSLTAPVDVYSVAAAGGEIERLTAFNADRLSEIEMGEPEPFQFAGFGGEMVHGWVVKPHGFDPEKLYPLAFLIHGGPQGSFGNDFHYRWNPQTYAGAGYAAVMIDFHGSTGYGQAFTDSIRRDWGGKPLEDLKLGLAAVLAAEPWIDGQRACALGASYGGYMINWIAGQWPEAFRCLVNHDGIFDQRMMYYSTEELWFPEWENGGTYWQAPFEFEEGNPAGFVDRWKTPMLVIHGALDYRVPGTQGLATFTALQRKGIPSRLLWFPDENHWVLQPANSVLWHETVGEWLDRWTAPGSSPEK